MKGWSKLAVIASGMTTFGIGCGLCGMAAAVAVVAAEEEETLRAWSRLQAEVGTITPAMRAAVEERWIKARDGWNGLGRTRADVIHGVAADIRSGTIQC